jgi:hypothetical protein
MYCSYHKSESHNECFGTIPTHLVIQLNLARLNKLRLDRFKREFKRGAKEQLKDLFNKFPVTKP